jgi:hypothetical protein
MRAAIPSGHVREQDPRQVPTGNPGVFKRNDADDANLHVFCQWAAQPESDQGKAPVKGVERAGILTGWAGVRPVHSIRHIEP